MRVVCRKVLLFLVSFVPLGLFAQGFQELPLDPDVRYGQLPNGLTYYIQHNDHPADRAEFYIVQKVGSIQEEESQRGLAHFLEHMAFNGTKNFPGKTMLSYLESKGVKFGTNVNAYTSIDETVYNLSQVPTTNPGLIDSCLLILHDWSGYISLEHEEIDSERGVIHEEWRTRQNAFLRMYENTILPELYPNNRYGQRMPIGLMEVVNNFPYQVLKDYYHTWYRPDLQSVIIVGNVDVDQIEARIKQLWQDIPKAENPKERVYYKVADNEQPIVTIASDKELTQNILGVMYKRDPLPAEVKGSALGLMMDYMNIMITQMLNMRFAEIAQQSDAPFFQASASYGDYMLSQTKEAMDFSIVFKENAWKQGLDEMMAVVNSAKEYGFNASEFERAKAELTSLIENVYNERDKQKNGSIVDAYVEHFLHHKPAMAIEDEYALYQQFIASVSLEQVNQMIQSYITPNNVVIMMMAMEKPGVTLPSKAELLAAYNQANEQAAVAYVDEMSNQPLLAKEPKKGKVKKERKGPFGSTEWTLSNGAKVVLKPTDFKKDQILLYALSPGGTSHFEDEDLLSSKVINDVTSLGGVGEFSTTDLSKVLSGKRVEVEAFVGTAIDGVQGNSTPKDLKTMLQLTHLAFTAPRQDQDAFEAWKTRTKTMLTNLASNPQMAFRDSLTATLYDHNEEKVRIQTEDIDQIDYNRIFEIQQERFKNAGDFTFIFVGNVDADTLKPLVERYIASLPAKGKGDELIFDEPEIEEGLIENRFELAMQTPKTSVYNFFSGEIKDDLKNRLTMDIFSQVMTMVYTETVREQEGGTYGVSSQGSINRNPAGEFTFIYGFDTSADKRARLEEVAYTELVKVAEQGAKAESFNKVKEYMVKRHRDQLKENAYWQEALINDVLYGIDNVTNYEQTLSQVTLEDVQNMAKKIVNSGNRIQVVATGVAAE